MLGFIRHSIGTRYPSMGCKRKSRITSNSGTQSKVLWHSSNSLGVKYSFSMVRWIKFGLFIPRLGKYNSSSMIHLMKEHRGTINSLVCNAAGSQVISASADGSCIVWDIDKGVRIHALFDPTIFNDVILHPDESQYLTCGTNFKLGYWDAYDGSVIRLIEGGESEMTCLDIQSDGNVFVSGSADKTVRAWHYDDGITLGLGRGHSGNVNAITISPNQRYLVSVGSEGGIFVWDMSGIRV